VFTPEDGSEKVIQKVHDFEGDGTYLGMFNTKASVSSFARSCFQYSLARQLPLKLSTKNTILKKYDGMFKDIFEDIYQAEYFDKFKA